MKKILLLLTVGMLSLTACNKDDDYVADGNTIAETIDLIGVDLTLDPNTGRYALVYPLNPVIYDTDVVLVYRRFVDDGFTVWQPIPRTLYFDNDDELDYDFNFSANDVLIYAGGNFDLAFAQGYTQNQDFRIVIVPSDFAGDLNGADYDEVARKLNIKESGVTKK